MKSITERSLSQSKRNYLISKNTSIDSATGFAENQCIKPSYLTHLKINKALILDLKITQYEAVIRAQTHSIAAPKLDKQ